MIVFLLNSLALIPLRGRQALGDLFGWLFSLLPLKERKIAELHIKNFIPDADSSVVSGVYQSLARSLMESLDLSPMLKDLSSWVECHNLAEVDEIIGRKKPILALTAHTGNWDLLGAFFAQRDIPFSVIGREARNSSLQGYMKSLRARYGVSTIWRTDKNGLREIINLFTRSGILAALLDQDTSVSGEFSRFFGIPAKTPSSLISLAHRYGAIILTTFIFREPSGRYRIFVEEIPAGLSVIETLDVYHSRLEHYIREYPEQWVWFHKRWRSKEDGTRLRSKDYIESYKNSVLNA